jgi:hypothetical protein
MLKWLVFDLRAVRPAVAVPAGRRWFVWQAAGALTLAVAVGFGLGFGYGSRPAPSEPVPLPVMSPIPLSARLPLPADEANPLLLGGLEVSASANPAEAVPNGKS